MLAGAFALNSTPFLLTVAHLGSAHLETPYNEKQLFKELRDQTGFRVGTKTNQHPTRLPETD